MVSAASAESLSDMVSRELTEAAALAASCNRYAAAQRYRRAFGMADAGSAAEALDRGWVLEILGDHDGAMLWYRLTERRQACGGPEGNAARSALQSLTGQFQPVLPIVCHPRPAENRVVEASERERRLLADMARCHREDECLVSRMRGEAPEGCALEQREFGR